MGVLHRMIFSHTPDEARSGGLAKACVPGKNYSVPEKIELLNTHSWFKGGIIGWNWIPAGGSG